MPRADPHSECDDRTRQRQHRRCPTASRSVPATHWRTATNPATHDLVELLAARAHVVVGTGWRMAALSRFQELIAAIDTSSEASSFSS
jgi:hypothetical protein